jgi:hypothetical protein
MDTQPKGNVYEMEKINIIRPSLYGYMNPTQSVDMSTGVGITRRLIVVAFLHNDDE